MKAGVSLSMLGQPVVPNIKGDGAGLGIIPVMLKVAFATGPTRWHKTRSAPG